MIMRVNTREKMMAKEVSHLLGKTREVEDRLSAPGFLATKGRGQPKQKRCTINSNAKQVVIRLSEEDFSKLKSLSSYLTIPPSTLCRALLRQLMSHYSLTDEPGDLLFRLSSTPPVTSLSNREMDILNLMVQGISNRGIASALEISEQTVKNHITSILHKMKASNRTQAALLAVKHNLVRVGMPNEADLFR